jgi:hypothetical protein
MTAVLRITAAAAVTAEKGAFQMPHWKKKKISFHVIEQGNE